MGNKTTRTKDYPIRVTIIGRVGLPCGQGFKEGDTWLIEGNKLPANFCMNAFCQCVYHSVRTLRYGGEHRWDEDKDVTRVYCPDPKRQLLFEVRRLPITESTPTQSTLS